MNKTVKLNDSVYHIYESNGVYCTLVIGSEKALLIDSGFGCSDLLERVSALTDKPLMVLNTHGHFDHIQANNSFSSVLIHKADIPLLKKNNSILFKLAFYLLYLSKSSKDDKKRYLKTLSVRKPKIAYIRDGDVIDLGTIAITVVETPGHTKGSVCLLDSANRFVYGGDTISNHVWICLKESVSVRTYVESLERLLPRVDDSYQIVASHSDVPLRTVVIENMIRCCRNIDPRNSTAYKHPFCKKSFLYCEGLEPLLERYDVRSFEELFNKIDMIDKDVFRNGEFVSVVYRKDKLR